MKTKLKRLGFLLLSAVMLLTAVGCGDGAEKKEEKASGDGATKPCRVEKNENPKTYEEYYNNSLLVSVKNMGNTYRLKKAIAKARAGEDVTVAYIGGSITHGDDDTCYANQSYLDFAKTYCPDPSKCHYVNAGWGGTGSSFGSIRYEHEVKPFQPDIVFIEYASNDGSGTDNESSYESLIRTALNEESKPAVILILGGFKWWTAQYWMLDYGLYYNLPTVSYYDGYQYMFENSQSSWDDYTFDGIHPYEEGSEIVADYIKFYYEEADRLPGDEKDLTLPEPISNLLYYRLHMLTSENCTPTDTGSWEKGCEDGYYTDGWHKAANSENKPIVFEFESRGAIISFAKNTEIPFGTMRVKTYFNDELVADNEYESGSEKTGAINVPWQYKSNVAGKFRIEVSAADANPGAALGLIGVSYPEVEGGEA